MDPKSERYFVGRSPAEHAFGQRIETPSPQAQVMPKWAKLTQLLWLLFLLKLDDRPRLKDSLSQNDSGRTIYVIQIGVGLEDEI
jgi:hypothetical protein